jgi:hypothetical protein
MNKRQAKAHIFKELTEILQSHVLEGNANWPFEDIEGNMLSLADRQRVQDAANDLIVEFDRRIGRE